MDQCADKAKIQIIRDRSSSGESAHIKAYRAGQEYESVLAFDLYIN